MEVIRTPINGLVIIEPKLFRDERGFFFESFNQEEFEKKVTKTTFVQDNESHSRFGVLRGLHFQKPPYEQAKLVRCTEGAVYDVAVDLRKDSPTYKQHYGVILSEWNNRQFFLPRGFAHGFIVLTESATFQYKCDNKYNKESEDGIYPFDTELNIDWGIEERDAILSDKDKARQKFQYV